MSVEKSSLLFLYCLIFAAQTFLTSVGVIAQDTENKGKRNLWAKCPIGWI